MVQLLIIDGLNLLRRIYSALPVREQDAPDIPQFLNAAENAVKHLLQQHQPSHAVCVLEHYHDTWRHQLYPPYKANRKHQPAAMLQSFPALQKSLQALGIHWLDVNGYEADDIIASIVYATAEHDCQNLIISTDRLMAQLLSRKTALYDHFGQQSIDRESLFNRYAVEPEQLPDYYALTGSSSVNIPGIAGIGAKTAARLLSQYGNCDGLLQANDLDALDKKAAHQLEGQQAALYLYRGLFRLRQDCPIHGNLKDWRVKPTSETSP